MSLDRNESSKVINDVVFLDENRSGDDKIIGDIHGNNACLQAVLDSLQPGDRLFIVGDLTDRGKDSPGVMTTVLQFQAKHPNSLYVVRGNHETFCLDTIFELETWVSRSPLFRSKIQNETIDGLSKLAQENTKRVAHHCQNGGEWLLQLYCEEFKNGKIQVNDGNIITYSNESTVKRIKDCMTVFPYIIRVQGDKPFNIVHADMPMMDAELVSRVNSRFLAAIPGSGELTGVAVLSDSEKKYATWARARSSNHHLAIKGTGRNEDSNITYVGHTILSNTVLAVRPGTNTVNLDVSTFSNHVSLVVNHTAGSCQYIGQGLSHPMDENLKLAQLSVQEHLQHNTCSVKNAVDNFNAVGNSLVGQAPRTEPLSVRPQPTGDASQGNLRRPGYPNNSVFRAVNNNPPARPARPARSKRSRSEINSEEPPSKRSRLEEGDTGSQAKQSPKH